MTWLRHLAASLHAFDIDPARAVDALRPVTSDVWQRLSSDERRRFLRHVRVLWDLHRHRAPPAAYDALSDGLHAGRIQVRAARLLSVRKAETECLDLTLRPRGAAGTVGLRVRWLINCTGPERDLSRQRDPLVSALRARGLVQPDPLGPGAVTGTSGELVDAEGHVVPNAFVVGSWRMARLFESTAVPELREQAAQVSAAVAASVGHITARATA